MSNVDQYRGTGRTTKAIKNLPENGVYIVHHQNAVRYCEDIVRSLGKNIEVISISKIHTLRGRELTGYYVDHFVSESRLLSSEDYYLLSQLRIKNV
jgi:ribosomal protein S24E